MELFQKIASNISPQSNWEVLEANGLNVTPGLISPTSNIGMVEINALDDTRDDESSLLKIRV